MQRGLTDAGDVHRNLCDAVLLDEPADGLRTLQRAGDHHGIAVGILDNLAGDGIAFALRTALFAHVESDGIGTAGGSGVEVVVHSDEEVAGTDGAGTTLGHTFGELVGTEVGLPLLGDNTLLQGFVFTLTAVGEVATFRLESGIFVAEDGDGKLLADPFRQFAGVFGRLFHRDTGDGHKRAHIGGTKTRVVAVVIAHVDELLRLADTAESGFQHVGRLANKGDDRTVGGSTRIHIQQLDALNGFYLVSDLFDNFEVPPLAKIRYTFN